jgi:hypothetical protein
VAGIRAVTIHKKCHAAERCKDAAPAAGARAIHVRIQMFCLNEQPFPPDF